MIGQGESLGGILTEAGCNADRMERLRQFCGRTSRQTDYSEPHLYDSMSLVLLLFGLFSKVRRQSHLVSFHLVQTIRGLDKGPSIRQPKCRMKDYYEILEVDSRASQDEIKTQYRFVVSAWHPDKFSTEEQKVKAAEKTKEINAAYETLSDPRKREEYDLGRRYHNQPNTQSHRYEPPPPPPPQDGVVSLEFRFRSKAIVHSPDDLIPICDQFWDEAKGYLYDPHQFKRWFVDLRRNDLVEKLELATKESSWDVGLDKFLHSIKPGLPNPVIEVLTQNSRLENYNYQSENLPRPQIEIRNEGRGCCYGSVQTNARWLSVRQSYFAVPPGGICVIELQTNPGEFVWETSHSAQVEVITNSHNRPEQVFDFSVTTVRYPLLTEIEKLRDQGKWRLALEKLEGIDTKHTNADNLRRSIQKVEKDIRKNLLTGTAAAYGLLGGIIGTNVYLSGEGFVIGGVAGIILGPLASFVYLESWGGKNGKDSDYLTGGFALVIAATIVAAIAAIAVIAFYIIVAILVILLVLGFLFGGG